MASDSIRAFTAVCNIIAGVISVVAMVVSIRAERRAKKAAEYILRVKDGV
jgi:hypothetical protein